MGEIDDMRPARCSADLLDITVAIVDLLGDIIVYCRSAALKYGISLGKVLDCITDSDESKLVALFESRLPRNP